MSVAGDATSRINYDLRLRRSPFYELAAPHLRRRRPPARARCVTVTLRSPETNFTRVNIISRGGPRNATATTISSSRDTLNGTEGGGGNEAVPRRDFYATTTFRALRVHVFFFFFPLAPFTVNFRANIEERESVVRLARYHVSSTLFAEHGYQG